MRSPWQDGGIAWRKSSGTPHGWVKERMAAIQSTTPEPKFVVSPLLCSSKRTRTVGRRSKISDHTPKAVPIGNRHNSKYESPMQTRNFRRRQSRTPSQYIRPPAALSPAPQTTPITQNTAANGKAAIPVLSFPNSITAAERNGTVNRGAPTNSMIAPKNCWATASQRRFLNWTSPNSDAVVVQLLAIGQATPIASEPTGGTANLDAVVEFRDDSPRETDLERPRGNCLGADRQVSRPRPASPQLSETACLGVRPGRFRGQTRGLEREDFGKHPDGLV